CDHPRIKTFEHFPVTFAAFQDRPPTETCLSAFQNQEFEEQPVVVNRHAPFVIVVGNHVGVRQRPSTSVYSGIVLFSHLQVLEYYHRYGKACPNVRSTGSPRGVRERGGRSEYPLQCILR